MESFVADAIYIDAPPERVFDALTDPSDVLEWANAMDATISPRTGGEFAVTRADGSTVCGTVAELVANQILTVSDYWWERDGERRGPMTLRFTLEPRDDGVWIVVRQDGLDSHGNWQTFAENTRKELIQSTVTLKRHIEGI